MLQFTGRNGFLAIIPVQHLATKRSLLPRALGGAYDTPAVSIGIPVGPFLPVITWRTSCNHETKVNGSSIAVDGSEIDVESIADVAPFRIPEVDRVIPRI